MEAAQIVDQNERDALLYLEDQAYAVLLDSNEPVRSADIAEAIGKKEYGSRLVRFALEASERFAQIDRRWDLEARYQDKQRPLERVLREIIEWYGHPMSVRQIAGELSSVYERPSEYYERVVERIVSDTSTYFRTSGNLVGLRTWLLEVSSDNEEDVIFDNDLDEEEIESLSGSAAKVDWTSDDFGAIVIKFLETVKAPVSNKLIGFFRWRALPDAFDAVACFDTLLANAKLVRLSDNRWATNKMADEYHAILMKTASRLSEEVEEALTPVLETAEVPKETVPTPTLSISDRDLDEIAQIVAQKEEVRMPMILETIFEISPRDSVYAAAAEGLGDALRADSRFVWLGTDRYRMADSIPEYVKAVPPELEFQVLSFETPEGEPLDVELEDEGLEGGLEKEIHNPLVQDVGDEDPFTEREFQEAQTARCVLFRHHKKLGTFPLCQIPKGFFPIGASLTKLTLTRGNSRHDIWVNYDIGVIFGMDAFYTDDMPESGAVFELGKTAKADEFTFHYDGKTDPLVFIPPNRIEELAAIAEAIRDRETTTFELMCQLMQYHRKGIPYVSLFTEVNVVRRTTRRLVASILSSHYAFYQKPNSDLWHFDSKKVDQGFKKAKRKYVRK